MICPYCGKENSENASFCIYCGGLFQDAEKQSTSESLPPERAVQSEISPVESDFVVNQPPAQPEISLEETAAIVDQPATQPEVYPAEQLQSPPQRSRGGSDKWGWWFVSCFVVLCLSGSCVAVFYLFYSYSTAMDFLKSPTVVPTPSPTPSLYFYDDFSDIYSGWPKSYESDFINEYYTGGYRMVENLANITSWVYPDVDSTKDMIVEVDATRHNGPDENNMGVICRFQNDERFYYGVVSSDGYYGIIKRALHELNVIGGEYLEYSDFIYQGSTTNHIRLECIGNILTLYVNGHLLDQQSDSDYAYGTVGLIIATYDTPGTDILFDNFTVYKP